MISVKDYKKKLIIYIKIQLLYKIVVLTYDLFSFIIHKPTKTVKQFLMASESKQSREGPTHPLQKTIEWFTFCFVLRFKKSEKVVCIWKLVVWNERFFLKCFSCAVPPRRSSQLQNTQKQKNVTSIPFCTAQHLSFIWTLSAFCNNILHFPLHVFFFV